MTRRTTLSRQWHIMYLTLCALQTDLGRSRYMIGKTGPRWSAAVVKVLTSSAIELLLHCPLFIPHLLLAALPRHLVCDEDDQLCCIADEHASRRARPRSPTSDVGGACSLIWSRTPIHGSVTSAVRCALTVLTQGGGGISAPPTRLCKTCPPHRYPRRGHGRIICSVDVWLAVGPSSRSPDRDRHRP